MRFEPVEEIAIERTAGTRGFTLSASVSFIGMLLAFLAISIGSATAAPPPELWTKCNSADPAFQCQTPRGIEGNPRNGHVFVADSFNFRIVEFNALGRFIRTWGWDVVDGGGTGFEICVAGSGDVCKAGISGSGVGQFNGTHGIAIDSSDNIYIVDRNNHRVQKFDPSGNPLLMIGGDVNETSGGNVCPRPGFPGDVCKVEPATTGGGEPGEFGAWAVGSFITIDTTDNVYIGDQARIQRVNTDGVYQGEITIPGETVKGLATDASGNLYAIYDSKPDVRKITPAGDELATPRFKLPKTGFSEVESIPTAIAVDDAGHVYAFGPVVAAGGGSPILIDPIFEFDLAGNIVEKWGKGEFSASTGVAANLCQGSEAPGNLYVSNSTSGTGPPESNEAFVRAYGTQPIGCFKARTLPASSVAETSATLNGTVNPDGSVTSECRFEYGATESYGSTVSCAESPVEIGEGNDPVPVHADLSGLVKGTVYHFRLIAKVGGETETGSDEEFKTLGPPVISDDHVVSATDTEATLKALVNPEGFAAAYHFEYTTQASFEDQGFLGAQRTATTGIGSDRSDHAVLGNLTGLTPDTAYVWRIVAVNSSGTTEGEERTFTTQRSPVGASPCPNDSLRAGASAFLPDCRAYEMVSPVDKNGGDIMQIQGYNQATPEGDKLTYTAIPAFGNQPNAFAVNQYLAARGSGGWSNDGIHPPVEGKWVNSVIFGLTREFMAFTPDLCSAWLVDFQTPAPTTDGQFDHENLYRRDNCDPGAGDLEALTPSPPSLPPSTKEFYVGNTSVQGISEDGHHAIFVAEVALPHVPDAASGGNAQVYDRFDGDLSLVSVLPDGSVGDPTPGDGQGFASPSDGGVGSGWQYNLKTAVSEDGSRVYWSSNFNPAFGTGKIYLRLHPEQGVVEGECEEANACTVAVSPGSFAFFLGASPDGSRALYSEETILGKTELYEFIEGQPRRLIAADIEGIVEISDDLSRVYFVSRAVLAGSGQNSEGNAAVSGEPNLYLAEGGGFSFIGTLVEGDVGAVEPGAVGIAYDLAGKEPFFRAARTSSDGGRLAFESRAPLTGFDNVAAGTGKAAVEVFSYEAGADELICISCNPSGARPSGQEILEPYVIRSGSPNPTKVIAAAWIPTPQRPLHASNVLSKDGDRLFFNSNDALLPRDTNGAQDVYQWEAPGMGGCTEQSSSFFPQNGGCLDLISSGENPYESEFWEASADGRDVFFTTEASLLPQDPGLIDIYDARIGGGFAQPNRLAGCEGEACQSPPPPPEFATPASGAYEGPPNPKPGKCAKGKRRMQKAGKTRCVKKRRKAKQGKGPQRRADNKRRAGR